MTRFIFAACIGAAATSSIAADSPATAVAEVVRPFIESNKHAALTIGVITPEGQHVFQFGEVDLDGKLQPPDECTLFEIGSITKVFTGTLLAQLVLEKKIKLDDPVQPWLPADWKLPRRDDRDITFLHLATHTSSLPVQPSNLMRHALVSKTTADPYSKFDSAALGSFLADAKLDRAIGAKHEYSNLGVGLLGHTLAKVDGAKSFEELVARRILTPLGMKSTLIQLSDEQKKRYAPGHNKDGKPASGWNFATLEACGGIRSDVDDMLLFLSAAMGKTDTNLKPAFAFAQQPWRELPRKDVEIGFCWMRTKSKDGLLIWHNGGTGGYASYMGFRPKSGVGIVILCNCADRKVDEMALKILEKLDQ